MKRLSYLLMILTAGFIFQACNNASRTESDSVETANDSNENNNAAAVQEDDSEFMVKAANGGMMEVEAGKLAQQKALSQSLRDFASRMVTDHTKSGDELKALAATKNITLPATLGKDEQDHLTEMGGKTGSEFDKHYVDMMVADHDKTVNMFEDMANDARDADVKAWAAKTLPALKEHQQAIKAIKNKM
jgi:putative membrane protein